MNKSNAKKYIMQKVKNSLNYDYKEQLGEVNTLPSMTIPDQTMSIRTIVDRYAKGLPVSAFTPIYEGEDFYMPDPKTLDLVDRAELLENVKQEVESLKSRQWKETQDVENTVENLKKDVEKTPI
jgi:hypothetical protein